MNEQKLDISLCVIGDGSLRSTLESKAKSLNIEKNITFVGSQSNPYPFSRLPMYIFVNLYKKVQYRSIRSNGIR